MATVYLHARLEALRRSQNPDGGWSYYPGKHNSWLEPTVYAALALHGAPESDAAWALVRRWQNPEGSWKMAANVADSNWTSSLGALLSGVRGQMSQATEQWLAKAARNGGWPWKDEAQPAAEPTAWTALALSRTKTGSVGEGKAREFLLSQPLTPETCGVALLALQGTAELADLQPVALGWHAQTKSAATRARLALGLRVNGIDVPETETPLSRNLAVTALEALGAREGRFAILGSGGKA